MVVHKLSITASLGGLRSSTGSAIGGLMHKKRENALHQIVGRFPFSGWRDAMLGGSQISYRRSATLEVLAVTGALFV